MPFSKSGAWEASRWNEFYEYELRPLIEAAGYECERSNATRGNILKDIFQNLNSAHVVLADLTGLNYNVLYELGVRHSLSNRTLMITQDDPAALPFDLKNYGCRRYSMETPTQREAFKALVIELFAHVDAFPDRDDSPVSDFVSIRAGWEREQARIDLTNRLTALYHELGTVIDVINDGESHGVALLNRIMPARDGLLSDWNVGNGLFLRKLRQLGIHIAWLETYTEQTNQRSAVVGAAKGMAVSLRDDVDRIRLMLRQGGEAADVAVEPAQALLDRALEEFPDLNNEGLYTTVNWAD